MKNHLFILLTITLSFTTLNLFATLTDSLFVKINKLPAKKKLYMLNLSGGIGTVGIAIKNNKTDYQIYINKEYNSTFLLIRKAAIAHKNVLSYYGYNKHLNRDYINTIIKHRLFFIISEDKSNYLMVEVKPEFPPGFLQM